MAFELMVAVVLGLGLAYGLGFLGVGAWFIGHGRLPGWMSGHWKWPLIETITPLVVLLQGWAGVVFGAALMAFVSIPLLHDSLVTNLLLIVAVPGFIAGIVLFAWSTWLSRRHPDAQ